jgi:hypothetical protein
VGILAGCSKIGWVEQFCPVPEGSSVGPVNQASAGQKAHLACPLLLPAQPASSRLRQRARRSGGSFLAEIPIGVGGGREKISVWPVKTD